MSQQPNIILIVADDMGYGDFGVFNNGLVRTPSLDQLVSEGICLTQHYAGSPVCSPSRAALLTGRYPHRTGAFTPQEVLGLDRISLQETTLGNAFQQTGYRTALIGKWHNGALDKRYHPNARGFDEFVGFSGGWADYYHWGLDYNGQQRCSDGTYLTDVLTDEAIQFVQRHRQNPFFLCLMYNVPHSPLQAPQNLVQPYYDLGLRPAVATTYAMIEAMDRGVGRLMTELERQHLAENTIVMFTSDNGPAFMLRPDQLPADMDRNTTRFNCGFAGAKGSVYEGGIRVPMVVRWPAALRAGVTVDAFTHFTDWFPTLLHLAGGPLPSGPLPDGQPLDGHDIGPALRGEPMKEEPRRFWQFNNYYPVAGVNAAMREGDWKLVFPSIHIPFASAIDQAMADTYVNLDIEYKYNPERIPEIRADLFPERILPAPSRPELYNIREDPLELNNLSEQEPSRLGLMVSAVETWFEQVTAEGMRSRV